MGRLSFFSKQSSFISNLLKTESINKNLNSIYAHPFNQKLFNGSLSKHIFGRYLHDDYLYLNQYTLILKQIAMRVFDTHNDLATQLGNLAQDIVANEHEMQKSYSSYFIITSESKPGKAIMEYLRFLTEHAQLSEVSVGLCSILPCFWIYANLGSFTLNPQQLASNPYKKWIETYSDKTFLEATKTLAQTINQLAEIASVEIQNKMREAFIQAVQFELDFFDEVHPEIEQVFELRSMLV